MPAGLGLACVALDLPVTSAEANNGLVPIAAAQVPAEAAQFVFMLPSNTASCAC